MIFSFFTMMFKLLPCRDGSFYKDRTTVPKPINKCTDADTNIYCGETKRLMVKNVFSRYEVHIY